MDKIPNGTVLFVAALGCIVAITLTKFVPTLKQLLALKKASSEQPATTAETATQPEQTSNTEAATENNESTAPVESVKLNKFLLFVFPPKTYLDYGVSHLTPYVDKDAEAKKAAKRKGV